MSECPLREREIAVVKRLAEGDAAKDAARALNITDDMVRSHVKFSLRASNTRNAVALVAKALREGWIT